MEIDGHDISAIYQALRAAVLDQSAPVAIIARTIMGKGVSFMENKELYHGVALTKDQLGQALQELSLENDLSVYEKQRAQQSASMSACRVQPQSLLLPGSRPCTAKTASSTTAALSALR